MTTASRVSDSREAFEAFEAWKLQCGCDAKSTLMDYLKTAFNRGWRDALACQGPVVTVSDLEELRDEIRSQSSLKDHYAEWEETERMFAALIAKANGHE